MIYSPVFNSIFFRFILFGVPYEWAFLLFASGLCFSIWISWVFLPFFIATHFIFLRLTKEDPFGIDIFIFSFFKKFPVKAY